MKKNFTKTVLENGLRIITVPMVDSATTTVEVLVEAGSNYEDENNNGISHFLEHMCFKGTTKRPSSAAISSELDALGSLSNAFTGNMETGYWAKAHHTKTNELIEIVSDIFLNSTLPVDEIEREKGVIIEEINMYEDNPGLKVLDVIEESLYPDQSAGRSVLGPRKNIRKMTKQDFVDYKKKHYTAGAVTVVVSGKVDEPKVIEKISALFGALPKGVPAKLPDVVVTQNKPTVKAIVKGTDQTHIVLGFHTFDRHDKRNPALKVLSTVLGSGMSSRLFLKMREELGICYSIRSMVDSSPNYGSIALTAGVTNDRLEEAINGIMTEVRRLTVELVGEKELQKAKDYRIGNLFMHLESSNDLGEFYGTQELYHDRKIKTPDEFAAEIQNVTADEVKALANEIFRGDNINLALIGPKQDESKLLELLKI
jgi:predicted Zn-dependent peptidase